MKKIILAIAAAAVLSLTACAQFAKSQERVQFKEFLAQCKVTPKAAECVEFRKGVSGGAESGSEGGAEGGSDSGSDHN